MNVTANEHRHDKGTWCCPHPVCREQRNWEIFAILGWLAFFAVAGVIMCQIERAVVIVAHML